MPHIILALMLVINLTGCVGYTYSSNGALVTSTDLSPVELRYRSKAPDKKADKTNPDGSEEFLIYDETKWCGLTLWAIIPVPLWLPVCRSYTEVTYKDGKPTKVATQWVHTSGSLCGLLVPMRSMEGGYCQSHNDW